MKHFNLEAVGNIVMEDNSTFNKVDSDVTLAANSDDRLPTQKAIKTYVDSIIPSGTKMWFYADSAPVGWTIDSSPTTVDNILAIKGGTIYNTGGVRQGGWSIIGLDSVAEASHRHSGPNHFHTMPTHSHTGPNHRHTGPSHTHPSGTLVSAPDPSNAKDQGGGSNSCAYKNHVHIISGSTAAGGTGNTGYSGTGATSSVDPGNTNNGGTGNTGPGQSHKHTITQDATWRPRANVGIICSKD